MGLKAVLPRLSQLFFLLGILLIFFSCVSIATNRFGFAVTLAKIAFYMLVLGTLAYVFKASSRNSD